MSNTIANLTLEFESGLTEQAIEQQLRDQYGDDLVDVDVEKA